MKSNLLSIILLLVSPMAWAGSLVDSLAGKKTVFLGDSITQAGTYVSFTSYYLQRLNPGEGLRYLFVGSFQRDRFRAQ